MTLTLLSVDDAAASLSMPVHHFRRHVRPEIRGVRVGRRVYFQPSELEQWVLAHLEPAEKVDSNDRHLRLVA